MRNAASDTHPDMQSPVLLKSGDSTSGTSLKNKTRLRPNLLKQREWFVPVSPARPSF